MNSQNMDVYHGTTFVAAKHLVSKPCPVDVKKGGGELGRGFYAGDSIAMAASWARGKFHEWAVLKIIIPDSDYVHLSVLTLPLRKVLVTWRQLQALKKTRDHVFGCDVVYGPLATYPHCGQHKFESEQAENVLRASQWNIL